MSEMLYDKKAIGIRVQAYRNHLGLTQEQLAERIDKSLVTVADIERGAAGMSMETLFRLCDVLRVTPDALLLPEKDEEMGDLEWLTNALENSSERVRAGAIEILRAYLRSV